MNVNLPSSELLSYVLLIIGVLTAVIGVIKYTHPIMKKWFSNNVLRPVIIDCMSENGAKLDAIINQLTINGGTVTIKDDLQSIKSTLNIIRGEAQAKIAIDPQPMFITDNAGKCIFVNDALCELFGASKDEMTGFGWTNFLDDGEKKQKAETFERGLRADSFIKDSYHVINGDTGERIFCEYVASVTRDKNGNPVSVIGTVKRIS